MPIALLEAIYSEAARRKMTVTDFVGEVLGREVQVPYSPQEALLMREAALTNL